MPLCGVAKFHPSLTAAPTVSGCGASGGNVLLGPGSAIRLGAGQPGIRRAAFVVGVGHPDDPWDRYGLGMDGP